ncbi:Receptorlike tyrosine kinase [Caligus rogercresseyi]|uniref:Receptorlike tyrosine kinase n=1 Tax=Caligus rogercresseyi TaxID=217165 RepID=A0A7T8QT39_CALRO|nr:Receptorlike tyrosine kinase [Caligus rogercresseyi]
MPPSLPSSLSSTFHSNSSNELFPMERPLGYKPIPLKPQNSLRTKAQVAPTSTIYLISIHISYPKINSNRLPELSQQNPRVKYLLKGITYYILKMCQ